MQMPDSQPEQDDEVKLESLRRLIAEAFEEIDRGEFELVTLDDLPQFMDRISANSPKPQAR